MPLDEGISFLLFARKKEQDDLIFQRWLNGYQEIPFDEFKSKLKPVEIKSDEEILNDVAEMMRSFEKGEGVSEDGNI